MSGHGEPLITGDKCILSLKKTVLYVDRYSFIHSFPPSPSYRLWAGTVAVLYRLSATKRYRGSKDMLVGYLSFVPYPF